MKLLSIITAAALAAVSLSIMTAPADTVPYTCDSDKRLNALYEFDRQDRAVDVVANAVGTQANLTANKKQSDSTGTTFTNHRGYSLSAGYINKNTHTTSDMMGLIAPGGRFIVKGYSPVSN